MVFQRGNQIRKGTKPWNKGTKGAFTTGLKGVSRPKDVVERMRNKLKGRKKSEEHRAKLSKTRIERGIAKGANNSNWKGGITPINKVIRYSEEYKLWRQAVFKRDNYQCIWCGSNTGIEADHIKQFALFPELRFAIDNGRTLCHECHKTTETYMKH